MAYTVRTTGKHCMAIDVTGVLAATGGAIAAVPNPWGETVLILQSTWYVTTASTGAANLNIGIGATATTDSADIISALAVNGAVAGLAYNGHVVEVTAQTTIAAPAHWHAGDFITFTGDGSTVGLVGTLYIQVVPV